MIMHSSWVHCGRRAFSAQLTFQVAEAGPPLVLALAELVPALPKPAAD
jgi:hypothetical protein